MADFAEPAEGVDPERAAAALVAELPGWWVATDVAFGQRLLAAGARLRRHSHVLSRDLVRDPVPDGWLEPPLPAGHRFAPADRPAIDLAPACEAAYPPGHPDFGQIPDPHHHEVELEELLSGRLVGPLLRCSTLVVRADGSVAGAILVNASPGDPPLAGPWISQVFRHPDAAGIGGPLLRRALALAARDGLPALSLAVTHANPARAVYDRLGFREAIEAYSVAFP
jgi:GNAT superfamily N-acetyltransferase